MSPTARRFFGCFLPLVLAVLACATTLMATVAGRAIAQNVPVTDDSMAPALQEGWDALVLYTHIWASEPRVGSIAQVDSPDGRQFRRVVAGPGQSVAIERGLLLVDGVPSDPAEHAKGTLLDMAPLQMDDDDYFLLADDRAFRDSRAWGPLDREAIFGEPLFYDDGTGRSAIDAGIDPSWQRARRSP